MTLVSICGWLNHESMAVAETKGFRMTPAGRIELTPQQLDAIAWDFLKSEFTAPAYAEWPIDRRFDAYLHHQGRDDLVNDGAVYDALLQQVMVNIGPAVRRGLLDSQVN